MALQKTATDFKNKTLPCLSCSPPNFDWPQSFQAKELPILISCVKREFGTNKVGSPPPPLSPNETAGPVITMFVMKKVQLDLYHVNSFFVNPYMEAL